MRLDLFLKASRLSPRRTVAQTLCDAGAVSINGARAKSAHVVRVGDKIDLRRHDRLLSVRVLAVPATRQSSRVEASSFYEVIDDRLFET